MSSRGRECAYHGKLVTRKHQGVRPACNITAATSHTHHTAAEKPNVGIALRAPFAAYVGGYSCIDDGGLTVPIAPTTMHGNGDNIRFGVWKCILWEGTAVYTGIPSIVPVDDSGAGCPLVPVEPLGADGVHQSGSVRSSADNCSSGDIVGWRVPALSRDHYCCTRIYTHEHRFRNHMGLHVLQAPALLVNMEHAPHTVRNPPPAIQVVKKQHSTSRERSCPSRHLRGAAPVQRRAAVGEGHGQLLGRFNFSRQVLYSSRRENTRT